MSISHTLRQGLWLACAGWVCMGAVQAQSVYRIVGPDGKVTFSDRAPEATAAGASAATNTARANAGAGPAVELPYELRRVAQRFPVTLYTGENCAPCTSARNMLLQRGVPFTERTVTSNEDIDALQRLSGANSLPYGTIGGQKLLGFSELEWSQYLNAAGYPQKSSLPANYQRSAATPLVAIKAVEAAPDEQAAAAREPAEARPRPARPVAPSGPSPSNPAGIKF